MRCVRVVIANRNPLVSQSLTSLLSAHSNFEVIASGVSLSECVRVVRIESPDIAIIESLISNGTSGFDILAAIASACLFTRVVFLATSCEPTDTSANGSHELALKGTILAQCLSQIAASQRPANPASHNQKASPGQMNPTRAGATRLSPALLTDREREIIHEISEGLSNKEAAHRLNISEGTIKLHLHHIYHKLSLKNRTELVAMAVTHSGPAWLVV